MLACRVDPVGSVGLGVLGHGLVDRSGKALAPAGVEPVLEGAHDRDGRDLARDLVRLPHLGRDRGRVVGALGRRVVAAVHHHATERQVDEVAAAYDAHGPSSPKGLMRR